MMFPFIKKSLEVKDKLALLSQDSRYDLACSCGTAADEHRRRSKDGRWIYPVTDPGVGSRYLFKTLLSNKCVNDCGYCPLRSGVDTRRCSLGPEELANTFLSYCKAGKVGGLFLSSAVERDADSTMERLNQTALILRRRRFKGFIHLKVIPGASDEAIRQSVSLANAVSVNIETPGEHNFCQLSTSKNYSQDILRTIKLISHLTAKGSRFDRVKQTTQFIVGAGNETDSEIISSCWKLYKELSLQRVYFSAYQRSLGSPSLPGERSQTSNGELLTREHRLYQVDWLIRKYAFKASEIPLDDSGNLSLSMDPKEAWAKAHPEFFPVNVNRDNKYRLLRVPGLGETLVSRIFAFRKNGSRIGSLADIARPTKLMRKAQGYVTY